MGSKNLLIFLVLLSLAFSQEDICTSVEDCNERYFCDGETSICMREPLFPMTTKEVLGSVLSGILIGLCQAAGIGGGTILTPVFMTFFNFTLKHSIAINFVVIFTGSIGKIIEKSREKYPLKDNDGVPLIDHNLALLSIPMMLTGAIFGVAIHKWLPDSFIGIILIFSLVTQSLLKTWKAYKLMRRKEIEQEERGYQMITPKSEVLKNLDTIGNPELDLVMKQEKRAYPKEKYVKVILITALIVFFSVLKGGKGLDSIIGITSCGWLYWLLNVVQVIIVVNILNQLAKSIAETENDKERVGYNFQKYGPKKERHMVKKLAMGAFFAGNLGGILGIGGAVILNPIWFEMGIPPIRATATASFTIVTIGFVSFFQVLCSGGYEANEILFFGLVAFFSSIIIGQVIGYFVKKYNRSSILLFILTVIIVVAIIIMPIMIIQQLIRHPEELFAFSSPC